MKTLCWTICLAVLGEEIDDMNTNEFVTYLASLRDKAEQWDKTVEFFQSSAKVIK